MIPDEETAAYESFRDALSGTVIARLSTPRSGAPSKRKRAVKGRKNEIKPVRHDQPPQQLQDQDTNDAADLADFIEVGPSSLIHHDVAPRLRPAQAP